MSAPADPPIEELLRHARWIEELAHRLVRDPAVADDLAQSAWVLALRDPERPRANVRGWFARVLRNLARERHRREVQRAPVERRGARAEELPSPDELLERAEAERALVDAVTRLDEPHRTTLLLRYFEGLLPAEIARREGVTTASVEHRLTRAHARLRERLGEREERGWLALLAPIVAQRPSFVVPSPEVVVMKVLSIAVVACALVAVGVFLFLRSAREDAPPLVADHGAVAKTVENLAPSERVERAAAAVPVASAAEPAAKEDPAAAPAPDAAAGDTSRIRGRVLRPDGAPAARRKVRLVDMQPANGSGSGVREAVCDDAGEFDLPGIEAGVWSVSTWPDEAELTGIGIAFEGTLNGMSYLAERTVELARGATADVVLGAPPERPVHVHGRVLLEGRALDLSAVQWLPAGEGMYDRKKNARTVERTTYDTVLDGPGRYYVTATVDSARPEWTVDVPDQRELELDFTLETNVVEGRVVDQAGAPAEGASVQLAVSGGRRAPLLLATMGFVTRTSKEGAFRFAGLAAGSYVVTASAEKLGASAAASGVVRAQPAGAKVELVLAPGVVVPVRVVGADGKERFADVFVFDAQGTPLNASLAVLGGKAGARTLAPLLPGRYSAVAAAGRTWSSAREFEVSTAQAPEVLELVLAPAASVTIDARATPNAFIELVDEAGRRFGALVDRNRFNRALENAWDADVPLLRAPPGNYVAQAIGADGVVASARVALVGGNATTVVLKR